MIISPPVITIDGPSGVGKGTLCKAIAKVFKWNLLDSGAIYRALALLSLYYRKNIISEENLVLLARNMNIEFIFNNNNLEIILEGKNVNNEIYTQKIAKVAAQVASFPRVRKALLCYQRSFREFPGLIADGRDMGTVVFPDAIVKIFLCASLEERARRRFLQLQEKGFNVRLECLLSEIKERDNYDYNRITSPLIPAKDALILNSTILTIEQVIEKALQYVYKKLILYKKN